MSDYENNLQQRLFPVEFTSSARMPGEHRAWACDTCLWLCMQKRMFLTLSSNASVDVDWFCFGKNTD